MVPMVPEVLWFYTVPRLASFLSTMDVERFRAIALGMKGATESAHMGHPDFRVNGRIFATIHPDRASGMVKLTPEEQEQFIREARGAFKAENGAWGREGCTRVRLDVVDEETLGEAMTLAWRAAVAKGPPASAKGKAARARKSRTGR